MPRVIVQTDRDAAAGEPVVTLQEWVVPEHLDSEPGAQQFIERIGWALLDAAEHEATARPDLTRSRAGAVR